jgi:hypothetical protein
MKKFTFVFTLTLLCLAQWIHSDNSDKISRVLEYKPAPGQHINRLFPTPAYSAKADSALLFASNCLVENKSMLGLGSFGGYVVVGFDHPIVNVPGEYDFKALGNASNNGAEPGIVSVCQDLNKNGIPDPDEPWYELAGSDYNKSTTIHNYQITYYRPNPDKQKSNIAWKDNQGNVGVVTHISFASQATMYPLWMPDSISFKGTRLAGNATGGGTSWALPALDWGYVDNWSNSSAVDKIGFNIDWAVDASGNKVHLDYIDFVKIHTGMVQEAGWLGETSTEVTGIVDLHPEATLANYPPTGEAYVTLDLQNTITLANNPLPSESHWADTYVDNKYLESQKFIFSHRTGWGGTYWDGFTVSNHTDNSNFESQGWSSNQWGSMAKGGYNGEGSNFLVANWGYFSDYSATNVTETSNYVKFNDGKTYGATGVYVNNSPWAYYNCKEGDAYARKFAQGDYFKLIAKGYAADGTTVTGSAEYYLADYRSVDSTQWRLNTQWEWFDLTQLGTVSYIQFTMESSDSGEYGMNTAGYFCLDKLTVKKVDDGTNAINPISSSKAYRSGGKLLNLTLGDYVEIYTIGGALYYKGTATTTELDIPERELFVIKVRSTGGVQILR